MPSHGHGLIPRLPRCSRLESKNSIPWYGGGFSEEILVGHLLKRMNLANAHQAGAGKPQKLIRTDRLITLTA